MQHDPRRGDRCDRRNSLSYLLSLSQRSLSEISAYLDDHEGGCPEKCFLVQLKEFPVNMQIYMYRSLGYRKTLLRNLHIRYVYCLFCFFLYIPVFCVAFYFWCPIKSHCTCYIVLYSKPVKKFSEEKFSIRAMTKASQYAKTWVQRGAIITLFNFVLFIAQQMSLYSLSGIPKCCY